MATTINITIPDKGDVFFSFEDKLITADNTIDEITAQELANAIRDAEDDLLGQHFDKIADMAGKTAIGGDVATGIIIELLGWSIVSAKTSGSFTLKDGTIIGTGVAGDVFSANENVSQVNLMTQAGVITTTVGGSGLSTEEHGWLSDVKDKTSRIQDTGSVPTKLDLIKYLS